MTTQLLAAVVTISLALVCYTIGVWMEHFQKKLKPLHLVFF